MTSYDAGTTWANKAHQELIRLSGDDANALMLLTTLFDAAYTEAPVDVANLRAHCAEPSSQIDATSMDMQLVLLRDYIATWLQETDEAVVRDYERAIVGGLFTLRTGSLPCWTCQETAWHVGMITARAPAWTECPRHHEISTARMLTHRPLLRAV